MRRGLVWLGVAGMGIGSFGPWADVRSWQGASAEPGVAHGGTVLLAFAAACAVGSVMGARVVVAGSALAALIWAIVVFYELPGSLVANGAWSAEVAWGLFLVVAGAILALIGAVIRVRDEHGALPRLRRDGRVRADAR
jgi:hypothetical protein